MPVLDLPMLQPSTKAASNGDTPAKDVAKSESDESSQVDFDATYASEAEEEAARSEQEKSEAMAGEAEEEKAGKQDAPPDDAANPDLILEEETPEGKMAAVTADGNPNKKDDVQKSNVGATELAFAQRVALTQEERATKPVEAGPEQKPVPSAQQLSDADDVKITAATPQEKRPVESLTAGVKDVDKATMQAERANRQADLNVQKSVPLASSSQSQNTSQAQTIMPADTVKKPDDMIKRDPDGWNRSSVEVSARTDPKSKTPTPSISPMSTVTPQPLTQIATAQEAGNLDIPMMINGDADAPTMWDPRSTTPATLAQTLARPETPGMIGRQMAEILQRMPDRPVELALNPEELGRVRLSISAAEAGITVSVLAERPETLDLMRRHIDQLAREFQALGYTNINFAFNEGQSEQNERQGGAGTTESGSPAVMPDAAAETPPPTKLGASTGVDLRL